MLEITVKDSSGRTGKGVTFSPTIYSLGRQNWGPWALQFWINEIKCVVFTGVPWKKPVVKLDWLFLGPTNETFVGKVGDPE